MKPIEYKDIVSDLPRVNEPAEMYYYTRKTNIGNTYLSCWVKW